MGGKVTMTTPPSVGSDADVPGPVFVDDPPDGADRRPPDGAGASSADPEATAAVPEEQVTGNGAGHGHTSARRRQRRTRRRAPAGSSVASVRPDRTTATREATERAKVFGPPLPLAGRPKRVWREQVLVRAGELATLAVWMESRTDGPSTPAAGFRSDVDLDLGIQGHLETARAAAQDMSFSHRQLWARMERAFAHLDAAETALLLRAPDAYLRGELPALLAHVRAHLPPAHPKRLQVERLAEKLPAVPVSDADRASLVGALRSASSAARREHARLRSFKNIVLVTAFALSALAGSLAYLGSRQPAWIPLCFAPQGLDKVVCPTAEAVVPAAAQTGGTSVASAGIELDELIASTAEGHDIALVMLIGLAAAAVTGAAALRRMRGTSTPFAVPMALVLLKLPTGALTAVLGLLLLGGGFVPGLSALDSSGQILGWALIFGAAQQLVTGVVDKQAQTVLESVGPKPMTKENE
jgi:hypothetical protein